MTLDEIVGGAYTPPQRRPREIRPKIERESENMPKQHSDSLRKVLLIIPNLSDSQLESALDYLKYLVGNSERD